MSTLKVKLALNFQLKLQFLIKPARKLACSVSSACNLDGVCLQRARTKSRTSAHAGRNSKSGYHRCAGWQRTSFRKRIGFGRRCGLCQILPVLPWRARRGQATGSTDGRSRHTCIREASKDSGELLASCHNSVRLYSAGHAHQFAAVIDERGSVCGDGLHSVNRWNRSRGYSAGCQIIAASENAEQGWICKLVAEAAAVNSVA